MTSAAVSGLQAAQAGLNAVSDNISNVNTTGYIQKVIDQTSTSSGGSGTGVTVQQVQLTANRFLQQASLNAAADAGSAGAAQNLWDQAQGLFGDPSTSSSFFNSLDSVFSSFSTLATDPSSSAASAAAVSQVQTFFSQASSISSQLQGLTTQADSGITSDVQTANQLLTQIAALNTQISQAKIETNDATGPQDQQSELINQLSSLMNVQVVPLAQGGVSLRLPDGTELAGAQGAAQLSYGANGSTGELSVTTIDGTTQPMGARLTSGEIQGYLQLRNTDIPGVQSQLSEFVSQTANTLNAIHNSYSSVPAPNQLTGTSTNQDIATAVGGFTGQTTIAITNSSNVIQQQVAIDFSAGTMSVNNGAPVAFTPSTFLSTLNSALGAYGSASYSAGGALTLTATSGDGVAVADGSPPSQKAGEGFSDFFGLNNLVQSSQITNYNTGLAGTDPMGVNAGGAITFSITGSDGSLITNVPVTIPGPPAATMGDLMTALNSPTSGVGLYGSFSLDADGEMTFTPKTGTGVSLDVVQDTTTVGSSTVNMSSYFGIGSRARDSRAADFSVRSDIAANPSLLATATLNLSAAAGAPALGAGDTSGADALSQAGQKVVNFDAAGATGAVSQTLSTYGAGVAGAIARKAAAADSDQTSAAAIAQEASARRSSVEGVNLDQELIQLATYQQAYNASARMMQAAQQMYATLLSMTGG